MRKLRTLACAALVVGATSAVAQSPQVAKEVTSDSLNFFGILDIALSYGTGSVADLTQLASGRSATSRWGVRGFKDLGGGLAAGFWLEDRINVDTGGIGSTNVNNQTNGSVGVVFGRRSTVSLMDFWGELRPGRDFTSIFRNRDDIDPFVTISVGARPRC